MLPSCRADLKSENSWPLPLQACHYCVGGHIFLAGQCYSMQGLLLNIPADLSSPVPCIAPFGMMKASQQRGSFQFLSSLIVLCAATNMCCTFSGGVFVSGRQRRAIRGHKALTNILASLALVYMGYSSRKRISFRDPVRPLTSFVHRHKHTQLLLGNQCDSNHCFKLMRITPFLPRFTQCSQSNNKVDCRNLCSRELFKTIGFFFFLHSAVQIYLILSPGLTASFGNMSGLQL